MKNITQHIAFSLTLLLLACGCAKEDAAALGGEGTLSLQVAYDEQTRAASQDYAARSIIRIYSSEGLIREYNGVESVPATLQLRSGNYRVDVSVPGETGSFGSFTKKALIGSQAFTVTAGAQNTVTVNCKLLSAVFSVEADEHIGAKYLFWNVFLAATPEDAVGEDDTKKLTFMQDGSTPEGYVTLAEGQTTLAWHFLGLEADFMTTGQYSGDLTGLKPGHKYVLRFKFTPGEGGIGFEVSVSTETENHDDTIGFVPDPSGVTATNDYDIWATRATLHASLAEGSYGTENIRIGYRVAGTEPWSYAAATRSEAGRYQAVVTGLEPATQYQYQLFAPGAQGEQSVGAPLTFTTAAAPQLPNSGFEEWNTDKGYPLPFAAGGTSWWSNGNDAAAMAGKVISTYDESTFVEGTRSAQLCGQHITMIVNKVAPGNIFTGEYIKTFISITNAGGLVNFGRPFTGRPTALKLSYKYKCGAITHDEGGPADDTAPHGVGDPDRAHIYIALGDWTAAQYKGTDENPVQVDTRDTNTLFDKDTQQVIAYGELVKGESVEEWTEVTIPIEYRDLTRIPTHIIVSATSSKLGDYLTGSTESILWIDNLQLIYE